MPGEAERGGEDGESSRARGGEPLGRQGGYGQVGIGSWRMPMEPQGDEGRDKLRKAAGRGTYPVIRGCPNGVTRMPRDMHPDGRMK